MLSHPIRLFRGLKLFPLPPLDSSNAHYQSFYDVYGQSLSDHVECLLFKERSLIVRGKVRNTMLNVVNLDVYIHIPRANRRACCSKGLTYIAVVQLQLHHNYVVVREAHRILRHSF